jgi:hypothetical protein
MPETYKVDVYIQPEKWLISVGSIS